MIKYSHHYKYCNSIGFTAKVQVKSRLTMVNVFEYLKRTKELGDLEVYTPENFKSGSGEWEKKLRKMKEEIASDGGGHSGSLDQLPMFTGAQGGWGASGQAFDPKKEKITCIIKAPKWFKEIHGQWIALVQDIKSGEIRVIWNGGHLKDEAAMQEVMDRINFEMTAKAMKVVSLDKIKKLANNTVIEEDEEEITIKVRPRVSEFAKKMIPIHRG